MEGASDRALLNVFKTCLLGIQSQDGILMKYCQADFLLSLYLILNLKLLKKTSKAKEVE
jgi:hypothetical protein